MTRSSAIQKSVSGGASGSPSRGGSSKIGAATDSDSDRESGAINNRPRTSSRGSFDTKVAFGSAIVTGGRDGRGSVTGTRGSFRSEK